MASRRSNDKTPDSNQIVKVQPASPINTINRFTTLGTIPKPNYSSVLASTYDPYPILSLFNCALASNAVSLPPLWYQSHSFLASDSVVVFSVSPSVSTRNFGAQLLCPLLTVVGATLVVK